MIKTDFTTEKYLINDHLPYSHRKAIAQFRCGSAPLQVELGRYDHGKYIPECNRICKLCSNGVEDEYHALFHCICHQDLQLPLMEFAFNSNEQFYHYDDANKYIYLMSEELITKTAKTCKLILKRRKEYLHM